MERCSFCKVEKNEDDFYMYSVTPMTRGRIQRSYLCKGCSDMSHGDRWYPITGYDQECEISNLGHVREIKGNRYYDITHIQNASTQYVYLTKNGKKMKKNILPLMKKFCEN